VTHIVLARHGQTDWNREHRWQGHADRPLDAAGREQARALAASLATRAFDAVYSSDLARARETADIVAEGLGLEVRLDPRLREVDVGEWSGHTNAEIEQRFPDGARRRRAGGTGWEHGETYGAMRTRAVAALRAIAAQHPGGSVLVVTHGGPMRAAWLEAGQELSSWTRRDNCGVDEIVIRDGEVRRLDSPRVGGLHQQVQR
jgi:probable phosphoglycerate mutase